MDQGNIIKNQLFNFQEQNTILQKELVDQQETRHFDFENNKNILNKLNQEIVFLKEQISNNHNDRIENINEIETLKKTLNNIKSMLVNIRQITTYENERVLFEYQEKQITLSDFNLQQIKLVEIQNDLVETTQRLEMAEQLNSFAKIENTFVANNIENDEINELDVYTLLEIARTNLINANNAVQDVLEKERDHSLFASKTEKAGFVGMFIIIKSRTCYFGSRIGNFSCNVIRFDFKFFNRFKSLQGN